MIEDELVTDLVKDQLIYNNIPATHIWGIFKVIVDWVELPSWSITTDFKLSLPIDTVTIDKIDWLQVFSYIKED